MSYGPRDMVARRRHGSNCNGAGGGTEIASRCTGAGGGRGSSQTACIPADPTFLSGSRGGRGSRGSRRLRPPPRQAVSGMIEVMILTGIAVVGAGALSAWFAGALPALETDGVGCVSWVEARTITEADPSTYHMTVTITNTGGRNIATYEIQDNADGRAIVTVTPSPEDGAPGGTYQAPHHVQGNPSREMPDSFRVHATDSAASGAFCRAVDAAQ